MKSAASALSVLLVTPARAASDHPVTKVIKMLDDLSAKAKDEGENEALAYEKFQYWCKNSLKVLNKAIDEGSANIDSLTSDISSLDEEIESLESEMKELLSDIEKLDKDMSAAAKERKDGEDQYNKAAKELQDTIDAVKEAKDKLSKSEPAGSALVQLAQASVRAELVRAVARTQGQRRDDLVQLLRSLEDPSVKAKGMSGEHVQRYEFKSGGIIELMKGLLGDFEGDLLEVNKEEQNAVNAFELAQAARKDLHVAAKKAMSEKDASKKDMEKERDTSKGDLADETKDKEADDEEKATTETTCRTRAREWQVRSEVRSQELEAMKVAKEILSKVTGVRVEAPSNPVPPSSPVSLLQKSILSFLQVSDPTVEAVSVLRAAATATHSKAMAQLAQRVSMHLSAPTPNGGVTNEYFGEVNNMIEKMIFRLQDEQRSDDEHKHWCDKEIEKTNMTAANKNEKLDDVDGKIKVVTGRISELTEQIASADKMVSEVVQWMEEATEARRIGKEENAAAVKDAKDAQDAIAQAVAALENFYKESGMVEKESYELLQEPVKLPKQPSAWDSGYTGVADPKKQPAGIIAVMETTAEEFTKMEADTRAQEQTDEDEYQQEMSTSKIEKARRSKESEMKGLEKKTAVDNSAMLAKNRKQVKSELDSVMQYMKDLQPACVNGDSTYEDRKAARTQELDALRKSEKILAKAFKKEKKSLKEEKTDEAEKTDKEDAFLQVRPHVAV